MRFHFRGLLLQLPVLSFQKHPLLLDLIEGVRRKAQCLGEGRGNHRGFGYFLQGLLTRDEVAADLLAATICSIISMCLAHSMVTA